MFRLVASTWSICRTYSQGITLQNSTPNDNDPNIDYGGKRSRQSEIDLASTTSRTWISKYCLKDILIRMPSIFTDFKATSLPLGEIIAANFRLHFAMKFNYIFSFSFPNPKSIFPNNCLFFCFLRYNIVYSTNKTCDRKFSIKNSFKIYYIENVFLMCH